MKANIRNDAPTSRVRSTDAPTLRTRYSNFGVLTPAVAAINFAGPGYLIGMLGLTYTRVQTVPGTPAMFRSDDVPTANIRSTD